MSYDVRFGVKVADAGDLIAVIGSPDYDDPTYNIGDMLRACMDWNFEQGEWYKLSDVLPNIERGMREIKDNEDEYKVFNSPNGWGSTKTARNFLDGLYSSIGEYQEDVPIEHLWIRW